MMKNIPLFCLSLILVFATLLTAAESGANPVAAEEERPRVALVLSGGGALGLAHIGVLQVLDQLQVPVDCVVGTSMGALVGGTFAAGLSPEEMERRISQVDLAQLFDDSPPRQETPYNLKQDENKPLFDFTLGVNHGIQLPPGVSAGYKFELFLKELIGLGSSVSDMDFDQLPLPYRAVATDLETGEMKVFAHGELPRAMRASMSLPAIISPTIINGHLYVDGALVRNLPVDVGRSLCGEVIIAVNLGSEPKKKEEITTSIDVALQSIVLLTEQNVQRSLAQLEEQDILILPDLQGFSSSSFDHQQELIEQGRQAALARSQQLQVLALPAASYQHWQAKQRQKAAPDVTVTSVRAEAIGRVSNEAILDDISLASAEQFDQQQLDQDLVEMFGRGDFSYVGYSLIPQQEGSELLIRAESKPWGPGYLKFGLGAATDFKSPSRLYLAASYRRTWLNNLGAELRLDAQVGHESYLQALFSQPLQLRDGAFIAPYVEVRRRYVHFYYREDFIGEYDIQSQGAGVHLGLTGKSGEVKIGPYLHHHRTLPEFSLFSHYFPEENRKQLGYEFLACLDQLDSLSFPRHGLHGTIRFRSALAEWGAEDDYGLAQASVKGALSLGKVSILGHLEYGEKVSGQGDLPIYELFKLGGPQRLSGFYLNQLSGSRYNLAAASVYHQYATLPSQLGRGLYLGVSLETGRINDQLMEEPWNWQTAGSIFWGADTILGRAYLGYGYNSLHQQAWYLMIGPHF